MSIIDFLTERFLKDVTPEILELGSHKFRRIAGIFQDKTFKLDTFAEVPSEGILNFYPDRKTAISNSGLFRKKIAELYGGRLPSEKHVSIILPDQAFGMGITHLSTVTLKINPMAAIERKVQSSMPLPLANYKLVFESGQPKGNKTPILFAVGIENVLKEITNAAFSSGLLPLSITPSCIMLSGLIRHMESAQNSPYPSVILHMGHGNSFLGIALNGLLRFMETIPIGGKIFVETLIEGESKTRQEIEKKLQEEKILLEEPTSDAQGEIPTYKILEPVFAELLKRIYEGLQTHSQEFPQEGAFRRILVSGGLSAFKNFDKLINGNLGLTVIRIGTLFSVIGPNGPLLADEIARIAPLLGGILLRPWKIEKLEKLVA
ncbi:MAG: cell division FtsA domain-containing protein [Candidatus Riflebacteria bacterium]|nr:cell division FtsA domain-containing protein [Candidatus Riflebacteria bacterium]